MSVKSSIIVIETSDVSKIPDILHELANNMDDVMEEDKDNFNLPYTEEYTSENTKVHFSVNIGKLNSGNIPMEFTEDKKGI